MRQIQKEKVKNMLGYKMVPSNLAYAKEIGNGNDAVSFRNAHY